MVLCQHYQLKDIVCFVFVGMTTNYKIVYSALYIASHWVHVGGRVKVVTREYFQ